MIYRITFLVEADYLESVQWLAADMENEAEMSGHIAKIVDTTIHSDMEDDCEQTPVHIK